jgi:hypothetical protein
MKFLLAALVLVSFSIFSEEIRVKKMTKDGELERSFVLKTNLQEKVVLDCQSFIQGLRIGEYEQATVFMLDPESCTDLQNRIRLSLRKYRHHCIEVESDIRSDETCR